MKAGTERVKPRVLIPGASTLDTLQRLTEFYVEVDSYSLTLGEPGWILFTSAFASYLQSGDKVDIGAIGYTPGSDDPVAFQGANSYTIEKHGSTLFKVRFEVSPRTVPEADVVWADPIAALAHIEFRRATVIARRNATTENTGDILFGPYQDGAGCVLSMANLDERDLQLDAKSFDDLADWCFTPEISGDGVVVIYWQ